jgi:hypothetical protein
LGVSDFDRKNFPVAFMIVKQSCAIFMLNPVIAPVNPVIDDVIDNGIDEEFLDSIQDPGLHYYYNKKVVIKYGNNVGYQ